MSEADILIVDDSAADRASMRVGFERSGYPVRLHFAINGEMALAMLQSKPLAQPVLKPHLCVIDVKMPGLSGIDVLRTIKTDPDLLEIPVIMYSGSDDQADIHAAYRAFASGFVRKPSDSAALARVVDVLGRLVTDVLVYPSR